MPHLSPMKWFHMYMLMMMWMMIFMIQLNFFLFFKPKNFQYKKYFLTQMKSWKF